MKRLGWVLIATLVAPLAAAAQPPAYDQPDQVTALDALLVSVAEPETPAAYTADDWVELSRLLATPCDQLRWLLAKAAALGDKPPSQAEAGRLAKAALQRGQALAERGLLGACGETLPELQQLAARLETPDGITDPEALRARLEQDAGLLELPPFSKFAMLSRGAPPRKLFARNASETWDVPRIVLDRLTERPELPAFGDLLDLHQRLVRAYADTTKTGAGEFAQPAQQQAVAASFQIAAALVDRALGLDQEDLAGTERPVPYNDSPEEWDKLAVALDKDTLRTWATLARVLSASAPAAQESWKDVRKVNGTMWSALDESANGWLVRSSDAGRLVQPRMLPLARVFNADQRTQRRAQEDKIRALLAGANPDANELFRDIQLAKAAVLGVELTPLTIDALKQELGEVQAVYLFVELIALTPAEPGQAPVFAGVAVYRENYRKPQGGVVVDDRYLAKAIAAKPSPDEVVAAALADGPPLVENGAIRRDARIIIAPDGPLPQRWFEFESKSLLQPTASTSGDPSWVVYTPSATALGSEHWTLDRTLRAWYRAAVIGRTALPSVSAPPQVLSARGGGPPLERQDMSICVVAMGEGNVDGSTKLPDFMTAKRGRQMAAIPLWVRK